MLNSNPIIHKVSKPINTTAEFLDFIDECEYEPITTSEVYEYIRNLSDPEHPLTLEQLNVVSIDKIQLKDEINFVLVHFTPTIPHCSMATLIGLCLRVKLLRCLPSRFKVVIKISPGTHSSESSINKQLNDKERVAAALENSHLLDIVNKCILNSDIS